MIVLKRSFLPYIFFYGNKFACLIKENSYRIKFKMLDPSHIVKPIKSIKIVRVSLKQIWLLPIPIYIYISEEKKIKKHGTKFNKLERALNYLLLVQIMNHRFKV